MPRRTIQRSPHDRNYYLIDANFLANRYIPANLVQNATERQRVERSQDWWKELNKQLRSRKALIYVPDVCIAEAFKVLAKKYYKDKYFRRSIDYKRAREKLSRDIHNPPKSLKAATRNIKFHDISTSRDIIISVDRFFETFLKQDLNVSIPDLLILAISKHLIDFFDVPKTQLFIVTLDNALWRGSKKFSDVPTAFNPNAPSEIASKVFV